MPTVLTLPADWHRTVETLVREAAHCAQVRDAMLGPRASNTGRRCVVIICTPDDTALDVQSVLRAVLTPHITPTEQQAS